MTVIAEPKRTDERLERFRAEIAEMRVPEPVPNRDRWLLLGGASTMVVGVVTCLVAFGLSHSTSDQLQQRDAIVLAVTGAAVSLVGGFVFLRYSLSTFLRYWLARLVFDQRERDDRLVALLDERRPPDLS